MTSLKSLLFSLLLISPFIGFAQNFQDSLSEAAKDLTHQQVEYDPSYFSIKYPMGDVPADKGVCTDVVVRAYRKLGRDLQQEVHEDMSANFDLYPDDWGLTAPDPNIDHRRVPNLMTFFERHGKSLPITAQASDYQPGHLVCWDLGRGIKHIGIVVDKKDRSSGNPLIVHNIGQGQVMENVLFEFRIIGHYAYP